jgi:D-sedoheptulose 7-phosphate isomerase
LFQDTAQIVRSSIEESLAVKRALLENEDLVQLVATVGHEVAKALAEGHKVLLFGNGGSAADAQHIAAEFVGRYGLERPGLPALALTTNSSSLTAIGNDYAFEHIFARQVEALGRPGDVAVGISTSGESGNVLKGIAAAKARGLVTVGFTGGTGGGLKDLARYCICVPARAVPRIQEAHILIGHIIAEIVDRYMGSSSQRTLADPMGKES